MPPLQCFLGVSKTDLQTKICLPLKVRWGFSGHQARALAGGAAVVGLGVHQDNVRTDALDAAPGDDEILIAAHHAEKPAGAGNHDGADPALRHIYLNIGDEAQPTAVADADDLLALQTGESNGHKNRLPE